jgi:hypothetical protein
VAKIGSGEEFSTFVGSGAKLTCKGLRKAIMRAKDSIIILILLIILVIFLFDF